MALSERLTSSSLLSPPHTGIVVCTRQLELLYANPAAYTAGARWFSSRGSSFSLTMATSPIWAVCRDLNTQLNALTNDRAWSEVEVHRMVVAGTAVFKLRGLVLPQNGHTESLLLILIELHATGDHAHPQSRAARVITERETSILRGLQAGMTNKEIATSMGVSVETVKEHLKRLMSKMNASTRTGLLARLLAADSLQTSAPMAAD
jgi:DNA-binding CsgD family transcriptional regulator